MKRQLLSFIVFPLRLKAGVFFIGNKVKQVIRWLFHSRETTNFTYDLTKLNRRHLSYFLSIICDRPANVMDEYVRELAEDEALRKHIVRATLKSGRNYTADDDVRYARRLGWYAIVRATKPKVVIETGVDKGLGSCVLTAALMKNAAEGYPGQYIGTDINPEAGFLLEPPYSSFGEVVYGDSLQTLQKLDVSVDVFINDSDHSLEYEKLEFETVSSRLSPGAIIIGDNSHFSDKLIEFADETGREFLYFQEMPENHWYPGAGIGAAFRRSYASQSSP